MNRSIRCKHGFCLETVGCDQCKVKTSDAASSHLRRANERASVGKRAQVINKPHGAAMSIRSRRQLRLAAERERQSG